MKINVSPFGSHCRSFLAPPSVVICRSPEPSILTSQTSLFATKASLSAPPKAGMDGGRVGVDISVGAGGVSVLVDSMTRGRGVASVTAVDVFVAGGAEVNVLTGASVSGGVRFPLKKRKPPARAAIVTIGTTTKSALNDLF